MPLDTIYLTRHGLRLNWSIDLSTGTYHAHYPTPTGIPVDPTLTGPGVRQSHELASYVSSAEFQPKPCRIYSSPFYRCLQTIQPTVQALRVLEKKGNADLRVRVENGLGEWFGHSSSFTHPSPASVNDLDPLFPSLIDTSYTAHVYPNPSGETIAQLHDRIATALNAIVADVDREIQEYERTHPESVGKSHAIIICGHAAPLIAMGRALTGNMPEDSSTDDFKVFTAGMSTFKRRALGDRGLDEPGSVSGRAAPIWRGGKGIRGGWDCVVNGECRYLSNGAERGWHFHGEEDFNSMPSSGVVEDSGSRNDISSASTKL
ncbi:transcription factor tau subunit [Nannizzia gypsea CBS 118893]|uniref:Transcription factor tau subunit n=1 Tax=Arthroderma gypseum (strain ATCC MYA-4604 / CBS 118893) TaxID=535722 RepID=E4V2A4_ARTGP|nr:transcription factor tau subunit [Nannizzia gypsea CBS 118893]EFR04169.1 transcription factor tau subunit [Nannizzia gypsea CBS 118893]